jgi:hypothetical protein
MLPFWVSFIIRTMSWINVMGDTGLINHFLLQIGLIHSPISMLYNEFTVLMALIMYLLPFMVLNIYVRLEGTTFRLHPNSLFEDGTGPGLETVGGVFQPSFETVHPVGGAYPFPHYILFSN